MINKQQKRQKIKHKIRKKIIGELSRPRLSIYKSLKHINVQLVDDISHRTILSVSTMKLKDPSGKPMRCNINSAKSLGAQLAQKAMEKGIEKIVFDRSGYLYHGKIKALAESLREAGLVF